MRVVTCLLALRRYALGWSSPAVAVAALAAALSGCASFEVPEFGFDKLGFGKSDARSQSPDGEESDELEAEPFEEDEFDSTTIDVPMVGDYITFTGLNRIVIEGVGLVIGLNGTGGDPPPSPWRDMLVEEMQRRKIRKSEARKMLKSPNTALVVVRAYLPPLVRRGDRFDIEVRIPGETGAKSLHGGRLWESILTETNIVSGQGPMKGDVVAKARGPILISTGEGKEADLVGVLKRGRVLGGGLSLIDRDMAIYVRSDFRTYRNITRLADRISKRFHAFNEVGIREGLAKAQTDQRIVLKVHPKYRENYPRYMQVIQNLAFRESPTARRVRMKKLEKELLKPETSERAALQLEAIGLDAIPILRTGLKGDNLESRFHSAVALTYLGETDGVDVLKDAAARERAFRVFGYAALSTIDDPRVELALQDLMSVQTDQDGATYDSAETRYGAFRSLWTLNPSSRFIEGEKLNKEYWLHTLKTEGHPIVHVTHRKRAEIVLFGENQEFRTPLAVRAGNHILVNARPGAEQITVSRFSRSGEDRQLTVSRRIDEVIRAAAELGATYPDISQMLVQAHRQHNLSSRFEIDALPQAGRFYFRDQGNGRRSRVGRSAQTPNMYQAGRDTVDRGAEPNEDQADIPDNDTSGTASLVDARTSETLSTDTDEAAEPSEAESGGRSFNPFRFLSKRKKE